MQLVNNIIWIIIENSNPYIVLKALESINGSNHKLISNLSIEIFKL